MKRHFLPVLLVASTLIVAAWLVLARKSGQPFKPFDLTARDFVGFEPTLPGWAVRSIPVSTNDPAEPNIAAFVVVSDKGQAVSGKREDAKDSPLGTAAPTSPSPLTAPPLPNAPPVSPHSDTSLSSSPLFPLPASPMPLPPSRFPHAASPFPLPPSRFPLTAIVRLVHGYNMPMCMKIKGYKVEAITDDRLQTTDHRHPSPTPSSRVPVAASPLPLPAFPPPPPSSPLPLPASRLPHQLWRVTSSDGVSAIWVTTMIRAGDFAPTTADICSMAFPRVDVADDPRWIPRGFIWTDLRHPVASLRQWGRARWNASRTDLLTFLRLRQPAWASEELLTYVTSSMRPEVTSDNEADVLRAVEEVHAEMLKALQRWRVVECGGLTPL